MVEWIVSSSALILLVLAVRALAKTHLSCRARYALWLLVLVRLLVPVQLFAASWGVAEAEVPGRVTEPSVMVMPLERQEFSMQEFYNSDTALPIMEGYGPNGNVTVEFHGDQMEITRYAAKWSVADILRAVWLAGAGVLALTLLISNLRFARRLRRTRVAYDALVGGARVYIVDWLVSPCLTGVFRPTAYLTPPCTADERTLRHVLAHETTHRLHGDCVWSLLRLAALCLHWYNPLVWLAVAVSKRDGELACDEATLGRLGEDERFAYGETLLSLVRAKPNTRELLSVTTSMTAGKTSMRERIETIARHPRTKVAALVLALAVLLTATVFAFSRAKEPEPAPMTEEEALDALEASVEWENNSVSFTIPADYAPVEDWGLHIAGRAAYEDGMTMSVHFYEGEQWRAGERYTIDSISNLTELTMQAALAGQRGGLYERGINLLPRHEWYFDLDGDGRSERLTIEESRLANSADASPVRLYDADGALLAELGDAGQSHVGWATYALADLDSGTYLMSYMPTMFQGEAYYSYSLLTVSEGQLVSRTPAEVSFGANPGAENDLSAMAEFQQRANDIWQRSRLLFTTDREVLSHLYDADNGADVTTNGRYYIAPDGATVRYRETMYGMVPEPPRSYDGPGIPVSYTPANEQELFEYLAGEYWFLSGAGGWHTELHIGADGAFTGEYSHGTERSAFSGRFGDVRQINSYTWSIRLRELDASAYGIEGADEVLVYLPGAPVDALPEEFVQWYCAGLSYGRNQIGSTLPTVGLYNVNEQYGWFARSLIDDGWEPLPADELTTWAEALRSEDSEERWDIVQASIVSCFLTSYYYSPRHLDLEEFLAYFPIQGVVDETELDALRAAYAGSGWRILELQELPVPVHRYRVADINAALTQYAGITLDDMSTDWRNEERMLYLPEYDAFYNFTSDFGPGMFAPESGEHLGSIVRLYGNHAALQLSGTPDSFQIMSFTER